MAGFQLSINGRFWVSTEDLHTGRADANKLANTREGSCLNRDDVDRRLTIATLHPKRGDEHHCDRDEPG